MPENIIMIGDCRDIIPTLTTCFDLVIADPLYDLNHSEILNYYQVLRNSMLDENMISNKQMVIFSPPNNQFLPEHAQEFEFWIKPISTKNTSRRHSKFVEMIFIFIFEDENGRHTWNADRHWSQYTNVHTDLVDSKIHPWRKPPSLIERIILNRSNPGDWILDPFAGSGVVHEVAKKLGRNSVSIEIDLDAPVFEL